MAKRRKNKSSGDSTWKWAVGTALAMAAMWLTYYQWSKDRHPSIRFISYTIEGTPGKTSLRFRTRYKNLGKTDAIEVNMESGLFFSVKYDPSVDEGKRMPHSKGTIGPGVEFNNGGHDVTLADSIFMVSPGRSPERVWLHERIHYKDEDGKDQPPTDNCLMWEQTSRTFVTCPEDLTRGTTDSSNGQ